MAAAERTAPALSRSRRGAVDELCRSAGVDASEPASAARCARGKIEGKPLMLLALAALALQPSAAPTGWSAPAPASTKVWPTREADVVIRNFRFRSGETLRELRMHYTTLGSPHRDAGGQIDNAVMVLHGTGGDGKQFLRPQFADELYGPGQPLDIRRYWVVLPDNIG